MSNQQNNAKKGATKAISVRISIMFVVLLIASILIAEGLVIGFGYGMVKDLIDTVGKVCDPSVSPDVRDETYDDQSD